METFLFKKYCANGLRKILAPHSTNSTKCLNKSPQLMSDLTKRVESTLVPIQVIAFEDHLQWAQSYLYCCFLHLSMWFHPLFLINCILWIHTMCGYSMCFYMNPWNGRMNCINWASPQQVSIGFCGLPMPWWMQDFPSDLSSHWPGSLSA